MLMEKKVVLDTNFLLIPGQLGIDIFSGIEEVMKYPYKLYIFDRTIEELEKIKSEQTGKHRDAAKLALELVKSKHLNIIRSTSNQIVDDLIFELALTDRDVIVATQDKGLKKRVKHNIIYLKQKKYIAIK